jgi:hypothetical protein
MMYVFTLTLIGTATMILAAGHALNALWSVALMIVAVGLLWLIGQWRGLNWTASLGFTLFVLATIYGTLQGISLLWLLPGILTTLVAWDLSHFGQYLSSVEDVRKETNLRWHHFLRLGIIIGLGSFLSISAISFETELHLMWAILLGLMAIIGLSQAVRFLQRESD